MVNNEIKAKKVRLITEESNAVIDTSEAIKLALEEELDLICISTSGEYPVVKIGDYSKFLYEEKKKNKENQKKNKQNEVELKEVRISDSIDLNDLKTKAKMIDKFLEKNNKVKISVRYKGRAISHISEGHSKITSLTDLITSTYIIDSPSKITGNIVSVTIAPSK